MRAQQSDSRRGGVALPGDSAPRGEASEEAGEELQEILSQYMQPASGTGMLCNGLDSPF